MTAQPLAAPATVHVVAIYPHQPCPWCKGEGGAMGAIDSPVTGAGGEAWSPCDGCREHQRWELRVVHHESMWWALACPETDGAPGLADSMIGYGRSKRHASAWVLQDEWLFDRLNIVHRRVAMAAGLPL